MDVKTKVTRTYDLLGLTEQQATDILDVCCGDDSRITLDIRDPALEETLNVLRNDLLNAGAKRSQPIDIGDA